MIQSFVTQCIRIDINSDVLLITIVIKVCAFVISTVGPHSGPKWRDLAANEKQN
jgi:hypothetical protein